MTGGLAARLLGRLGRHADSREPGRTNHISLGSHCHMAQVLKETGLRGWSGPFDWIFSSAAMVRDCLANDFARLLDPAEYETVPPEERPDPALTRCRHRYYRACCGVPVVFNHHDPATSPEDYRFLEAGVRRLRAALADPEAVNQHYILSAWPVAPEDAIAICDMLSRAPSRNRVLVLQVEPGAASPRAERIDLGMEDLDFHRIHTRSASLGLRFAEDGDDALVRDLVRAAARRDRPGHR
ncbi:conserved hypothetical protein [Methylobacterium sp. 4-46]|uniref:papain-like cysteine peptidase n=1 Tax=unclassified Methylobacterium TaxID=2615210 RepID=UPI000152C972|nr:MULTISPECIES: papain-like cysteine peptidase [Methylobacterium]ACA19125.1 conserved hypothetical protein [Methylobacterium sp. 4-46]WFT78336.1 papain-like cysteine peptidase [Methylobacterium nodulans]